MSTTSTIALVVFDMAGTTVDDQGVVNRCFRDSLAESGLAVEPELVDSVMGLPKPEAFRTLIGASPLADRLADSVEAIHKSFVDRMVAYYTTDPSVREVIGIGPLFLELRRRGVAVGVNTGFSREIADVIIERLNWGPLGMIDASVTSDEVKEGRPHPDMILNLMEQTGVTDPKRVAKVGDAPADLEEGMAARCRWVIGVTWGTHTREQLEKSPSAHLVDSVDELTALLRSGI